MDNFIEDVVAYLQTNGVGTLATNMFISTFTGSPDNQIMVNHTGGVEPDRDQPLGRPTVQIMVRNTDYKTGFTKARDIFDLLHQKFAIIKTANTDVMKCDALQEPTYLGLDVEGRYLFTCNFVFVVRL